MYVRVNGALVYLLSYPHSNVLPSAQYSTVHYNMGLHLMIPIRLGREYIQYDAFLQ